MTKTLWRNWITIIYVTIQQTSSDIQKQTVQSEKQVRLHRLLIFSWLMKNYLINALSVTTLLSWLIDFVDNIHL